MPSYTYKIPDMDIPFDTRESQVEIPVFANLRCNFTKGKIAPFADIKAGTYVTNNSGLYANLSVGCRIATSSKQAINVSVGYTTEKLEFQEFDRFTSYASIAYSTKDIKYDATGISIKVGYEF